MGYILKGLAICLLKGKSFVLELVGALLHVLVASLELFNIELTDADLLILILI